MELATILKGAPLIGSGVARISNWYRSPSLEVTKTETSALYEGMRGDPIKPMEFRTLVENIGATTVYDLRPSIYFYGIIDPEEEVGEVTVDTTGVWGQDKNSELSLRGGESEWLSVLRVIQNYSRGPLFEPDSDVYLIFPTGRGWEQPSRIRTKWFDRPSETALTSKQITRADAKNIVWEEARIEITGEDTDSNEVSLGYDIDLSDLRVQMDNRAGFFKDSEM